MLWALGFFSDERKEGNSDWAEGVWVTIIIEPSRGMTFKRFTDSWWFWMFCVATILAHGFVFHWDWITWCLLGYFAFTACVRIAASRRKKKMELPVHDPTI